MPAGCALTTGYTLPCADGIAGIKEIRIQATEYLPSTAYTVHGSGYISAIAPTEGKKFYLFKFVNQNTCYAKHTIKKNLEGGSTYWEHELQIMLNTLRQWVTNELKLHSTSAALTVIVTDRNGRYWLQGKENGLEVTEGEGTTGAGRDDFNRYSLKYMGQEPAPMVEVQLADISAITY
jgi:hypothetical protein